MIKAILFIIVVILLFSSCAVYYPQTVDIPLIKKKDDIRIDAGYFMALGTKNEESRNGIVGGHGTFSYGVTNILAIQTYINMDIMLRGYLHGALGLFKGFKNKTVMELYSGYGTGGGFGSGYYLAFTQFNIGKTGLGNSNIDYGLGLKGGYIHGIYYDEDVGNQTHYQEKGWIVEPSVFLRFGGKKVKFCTKVNYLWTKTISNDWYYPLSVSMGINLHLGKPSNNLKTKIN
jgi:hypothetical protein